MSNSQMNTPGRARTIVTVLVLTLAVGVTAVVASSFGGLPPAVTWAVVLPLVYRLLLGRRAAPPRDASHAEQVLLEGSNTRERVIQSLLPLLGVGLGIAGVTML